MSYSVWLRLSGDSQRAIQSAIIHTALKFGTPVFPAHLTLATGFESVEEAFEFAKSYIPPAHLKIRPEPVVVTENSRWQTTVVLKVVDIALEGLRALPYPPHISLVYNLHASIREALAVELAKHLHGKLQSMVKVGPVQVWDTSGGFENVPFWHEVSSPRIRYFDVAVNVSDAMFEGIYHGKTKHPNDRSAVIERAIESGCDRMLFLGGSVEDSAEQLNLARTLDSKGKHLFTTVGVHPTRTSNFCADRDIPRLREIISQNLDRVVALGEIGLDADRLHFSPMEKQIDAFKSQICLAAEFKLPLLLHFRGSECFQEFMNILVGQRECFGDGVVHSFTGTREEMEKLTELGLAIGINGCSLRDESFLSDVLPFIPLNKLLIETDAPYCDIRATHPSHKYLEIAEKHSVVSKPEKWSAGCLVKGRNEPCLVAQVADVVRKLHPAKEAVVAAAYANALRIFPRSA